MPILGMMIVWFSTENWAAMLGCLIGSLHFTATIKEAERDKAFIADLLKNTKELNEGGE